MTAFETDRLGSHDSILVAQSSLKTWQMKERTLKEGLRVLASFLVLG
jgi:hypothetical protein